MKLLNSFLRLDLIYELIEKEFDSIYSHSQSKSRKFTMFYFFAKENLKIKIRKLLRLADSSNEIFNC